MIVAIHQPQYLPRMQYFDKIAKADAFVFMDDVQFSNNNYQHYNFICTGEKLKVPIKYHFGDAINTVKICNDTEWQKKHLADITQAYLQAPFFTDVYHFLCKILDRDFNLLNDLSCSIIREALQRFGIQTKIIAASSLNATGKKTQRVIDICKKMGATTYLSGEGAKVYQNESDFKNAGIRLEYLQNEKGFDNLSFIDHVAKNGWRY